MDNRDKFNADFNYKFRAIDYNGKWVYGSLIEQHPKGCYIMNYNAETDEPITYAVKSYTIGKFTGLKHEKTKKEIYEGDIFSSTIEHDHGDEIQYNIVFWVKQRAGYYLIPVAHYQVLRDNDCENEEDFEWLFEQANFYDFSIDIGLDLCGNIHDNPELMELNMMC